jgi:hypothetical protein
MQSDFIKGHMSLRSRKNKSPTMLCTNPATSGALCLALVIHFEKTLINGKTARVGQLGAWDRSEKTK